MNGPSVYRKERGGPRSNRAAQVNPSRLSLARSRQAEDRKNQTPRFSVLAVPRAALRAPVPPQRTRPAQQPTPTRPGGASLLPSILPPERATVLRFARAGLRHSRLLAPQPGHVVQTPPAVSFTSTPTGGIAPYTYAWTFGDGGTGATKNINHTYTSAGTYTASVTVADSQGWQATANAPAVTVACSFGVVLKTLPPNGTCSSGGCNIGLVPTVSCGTPPYTYDWDFGDGTTATTTNIGITHYYDSNGPTVANYTAIVTVTDSNGHTASDTAPITVYPPPS